MSGVSEVWTLDTCDMKAGRTDNEWTVQRSDEPNEGWFDCAFDEVIDRRRVHEQIVRRAPRPRVFVAADEDNAVIGCGMATSARGHCGIFCMATRETHRRRGLFGSVGQSR